MDFDLDQAGGKARLGIARGALDLPGVFEEPVLPFDALAADLQWQLNGEQIAVSVPRLRFTNADAQGEGQGSWRPRPGGGRARAFPARWTCAAA